MLPWKVVLYGTPGIGKTTWASGADNSLVVDLEQGATRIDCHRTRDIISEWQSHDPEKPGLVEVFQYVAQSDYDTVVFDSLTEVEKILLRKMLKEQGATSLGDFDYGAGYRYLETEWSNFLKYINRLYNLGKNVILIGHESVERVNDPTTDSYDRYQLDVYKKAASKIFADVDAVFFCKHNKILKEKQGAIGKQKRAVGDEKRLIFTTETPAFIAKNRFGLPSSFEMKLEHRSAFWKRLSQNPKQKQLNVESQHSKPSQSEQQDEKIASLEEQQLLNPNEMPLPNNAGQGSTVENATL